MHEHHEHLVALVGQPNSGKSTVFNHLTGLSQTTANYPGVTVTKSSGHYHDGNRRIEVVDLPGTYSLTSYSQEERITRNFLLLERPEVAVAVVDTVNLRRHLYLVFHLLELQIPLIICLNMMDIAQRRGIELDMVALEKELGVPVIPTIARSGVGFDELRQEINRVAAENMHVPTGWKLDYGPLEGVLSDIEIILAQKEHLMEDFSARWLAVKLLENDREARRIIQHHTHDNDWETPLGLAVEMVRRYEKETGDSPRQTIAQRRNEKAEAIERLVIRREKTPVRISDRIDRVACHPVWGFVCVAAIMLLTFFMAFNIANGWNWIPWSGGWKSPVGVCSWIFSDGLPPLLDSWFQLEEKSDLKSLIHDGIIAGVGAVVVFVPVIFFIFLFISLLEQSGSMARVAVVLDRLMRRFGLHGQSVLPMILGGGIVGGCAVPAMMATRTMREPRERLLTILVIPLMNCGAKIPVYVLLISAFFASYQSVVMTAIILLSWTFALVSAWILGKTFVGGTPMPLVIELPTYQMPRLADLLGTACRQSWSFVKRAGTIILLVNLFLWALMYYPRPADPEADAGKQLANSYAGRIGHALTPISHWAGFDWRDNIALLGGVAAKEAIVSSLTTIYGIEDSEARLADKLRTTDGWTPFKAIAMLLFVMLYTPCAATCVVIQKETDSFKSMLLAMAYGTTLAFALAVVVFQTGRCFG